jgi:outer membrane protein assembly factor BamB
MKTIKFIKTTLIIAFVLIPALRLMAGGTEPLWTKDMKSAILWQKVTPLGQLIACTALGLHGIDVNTGNELWMIPDLKNAPESSYEPVANSPFISLSSAGGGQNLYVVNPFDGKIVFSSVAAGIEKVNDKYFLYENNKILVIGTPKGSSAAQLVMVDMASGQKLWAKSGGFSLTTGVKDLGKDEVLITSAFYAMKLKASTGDEIWKTSLDPKMANMSSFFSMLEGFASKMLSKDDLNAQLIVPPSRPDMFIIAAQKKIESTSTDSQGKKTVTVTYHSVYMAFDLNTGKHKWAAIVEMQDPLGVSFAGDKGLLVCSSSSGRLNMLNYDDGKTLLGKNGRGLNLPGPATGMAPLSNGNLLIVAGKGDNSAINILDPNTGIFTFEKAAKMKGTVSYTEILPGGILVGSSEDVNMLNTSTGEWFFEKPVQGGASLIGGNDDKVFIFNTKDKLLYAMDRKGTSLKAVSSVPLEFGGKEIPNGIEVLPEGILLKSDQNLALMDYSGGIKFNKYFPAPTLSNLKKALLIASAVRAAYYTASYTAYSAAFGGASQAIQVKDASSKVTKDVTAQVSGMFGDAAVSGVGYTIDFIKQAQQRFKATSETPDYMLIMTSEVKKEVKLVQVSKKTGEVLNTIMIGKDKDPVYDVDMVDGRLYYMKDASKMECYKF